MYENYEFNHQPDNFQEDSIVQIFETEALDSRKRIALVAHDNKKDGMLEWALYNRELLVQHHLYATGTTGRLLTSALDYPVNCLLSGPLGGDQQIGAMIAEGKLDLLIFFWDPLEQQPHDPDIKALLRVAVVWNVPVACDRATADYVISSPLMTGSYQRILPSYTAHIERFESETADGLLVVSTVVEVEQE